MFGLQYEEKCPFCQKRFIANHGITTYYKIKDCGTSEYVQEWCPHCGKSYMRCCYDNDIMALRHAGCTLEETIEKVCEQFRSKYGRLGDSSVKSLEKICRDVYSVDLIKICIPIDELDEGDLIRSSCVCW